MRSRKEWKTAGHRTVRKHYFLVIVLCLSAMFLGSEFTSSKSMLDDLNSPVSSSNALDQSDQASEVISDIIENNMTEGDQSAQNAIDSLRNSTGDKDALGHTRGVLANAVNNISSGKIYVTLARALLSITQSNSTAIILFILIILSATIFFTVFIADVFRAVLRRMFLEARSYEKVPLSHVGQIKTADRWLRASLTILLRNIRQFFWSLTVIGGIIKYYSYFMVDYIVAENPDIRPRDAVLLSRRMMDGHKWECFKLQITFIGWYLLGALTFGISDILYSSAYETAVYCEYYADIRQQAKDSSISGAEYLNDQYLFVHADEELLQNTYPDTIDKNCVITEKTIILTGFRKFMNDKFGIWTGTLAEKKEYQNAENLRYQNQNDLDALEGSAYPSRLNPLYTSKKLPSLSFQFLRSYTVWSLLLMFLLFSFAGWIWEVSLVLVTDGIFVNRGSLLGPWIPIYGSGALLILILLSSFRKNPAAELVGAVVISGITEFTTSLVMEMTYGMRWWDYTGYFLNLDGRICAEGLLVFAIGGMAVIYFIAPILDTIFSRIPQKVIITVTVIFCALFAADAVYSHYYPNRGEGVTSAALMENTYYLYDNDLPDNGGNSIIIKTDTVF